jgi:hypothetical protein
MPRLCSLRKAWTSALSAWDTTLKRQSIQQLKKQAPGISRNTDWKHLLEQSHGARVLVADANTLKCVLYALALNRGRDGGCSSVIADEA